MNRTAASRRFLTSFAFAFVASMSLGPACADMVVYEYTGGSQTFVVPTGVTSVNVLVMGGGGGGANGHQGGGGAGFLATGTFGVTPGQAINVDVGAGGTGAEGQPNNQIIGLTAGSASSFGAFLSAGGGQVITGINQTGNNGSSGGGGSGNSGPGASGGSGGSDGSSSTYAGGFGQGNYLPALSLFTEAVLSAGIGGAGGSGTHGGGGGGGGILINGFGPNAGNGAAVFSALGGQGYGAGGGGGGLDFSVSNVREAGGNGAHGVVYIEWQPIPEPSSLGIIGLLTFTGMLRRRR